MSASAGRVLIIPKGDYNSATTYNMLDMVYYGGKSYICKQTSTGNVPTNTVYWQIMLDGASEFSALSDVELNNLQNGDGIYYDGTAQKWKNTTPTSIAITSPPAKTDYLDGDILDLTGMVVTAYYVGGSSRNITTECTFSPANGATLTTANTSVTVTWRTFTATQAITVTIPIYGAEWDGTSTTVWTRTDNAVDFVDPNPYYAGMSGSPSSPFDDLSPWKDISIVEDVQAGTLVRIPKYYYKWTRSQGHMKLQISPVNIEGFSVSPAHMDRGDGYGERDYVYIGRYKCANNTYKSTSGVLPINNVGRRSVYRSNIHNLGSDIWQQDFAMYWTIRLLYLVEFANWDSQRVIGLGGRSQTGDGYLRNNGQVDSMPYHTGIMASSRDSEGAIQYRYMEDLWGNAYEALDGITRYGLSGTYGSYMYLTLNPANFSDSETGIQLVNKPSGSGFPISFVEQTAESIANNLSFAIYPDVNGGTNSTYVPDSFFTPSGTGIRVCDIGGLSNNYAYGLFYVSMDKTSSDTIESTRLMKLPANS